MDAVPKRILEKVHYGSKMESQELGRKLVGVTPGAVSYYVTMVVYNSAYGVHAPKHNTH